MSMYLVKMRSLLEYLRGAGRKHLAKGLEDTLNRIDFLEEENSQMREDVDFLLDELIKTDNKQDYEKQEEIRNRFYRKNKGE